MIKIITVFYFFLLVAFATAFLPLDPTRLRASLLKLKTNDGKEISISNDDDKFTVRIPLGKKERYVRRSIEQLEDEYRTLKEQLRHDLFILKHKQYQVAQEEDELLQRALDETDMERFAIEMDMLAKKFEQQKAHNAVEEARKSKELAEEKWTENQATWMDSEYHDLQDLLDLKISASELKKSEKMLKAREEIERHAQQDEEQAQDILFFLDEQEALLKEISTNPQKEHFWVLEELTTHHKSLLQVAGLELETTKLWNQLREDLLDLKQKQVQVDKEEQLLAEKMADIVDFQSNEQEKQIQASMDKIKATHKQVRQIVAQKEQAYKDTLKAIKKADKNPNEIWMMAEPTQVLKERDDAADAVKDELSRIVASEAQAEDLLPVLKQKGSILRELRLPGHEEALHRWVKDELSHHESMLDAVKDKLID